MTMGIHPVILILALVFLGGLACVVLSVFVRRLFLRILLIVMGIVVMAAPCIFLLLVEHPELVDGRFRTYKAFYSDIREGMTREEVFTCIAKHYPEQGERCKPTILSDTNTALEFFMDPEDSQQPNCEGIFLKMKSGKVIEKEYSPD